MLLLALSSASTHLEQVAKGLCAPVGSDEAKESLREAHSIYRGLELSAVNTPESVGDTESQGERDNSVKLAAAYTGLLLPLLTAGEVRASGLKLSLAGGHRRQ